MFDQPNDFRYTLSTSDVISEVLNISPLEWDESSVSIKKDMTKFFANKREFSLPLGFVKRGRELLKNEFLKNGVNGEASLLVELLDRKTWKYEFFYKGKIDFYNIDLDSSVLEINFLDNDMQSFINSNKSVEYEIDIDESDYEVNFPEIQLLENASFYMYNQFDAAASNWSAWGYVMAATLVESNIRLGNTSVFSTGSERKGSQDTGPGSWDPQYWDSNFIFEANVDGLSFDININGIIDARVNIKDGLKQGYALILLWNNVKSNGDRDFGYESFFNTTDLDYGIHNDIEFNVTKTIISKAGYKYYLAWYPVPSAGIRPPDIEIGLYANLKEGNLSLKYKDFAKTNFKAKSKSPKSLFHKLVQKMSNNENAEISSYFLESIDHVQITSGDLLRKIDNGKIKTSFDSFFTSLSSLFDIGFDIINGVPTIEDRSFFVNKDLEIVVIENTKNVKTLSANDMIFSSIRTGYESEDYDTELGRQELNNGQTWKTPISNSNKTLDLISKYRADAYGINDIIVQTVYNPNKNNTKTDRSDDNDVFFLYCDAISFDPAHNELVNIGGTFVDVFFPNSYDMLTLESAQNYSGIDQNDKYFNWMITPKRNLMRHLKTVSISLFGEVNQDKFLEMTSADKWKDLNVEYNNSEFSEIIPIPISEIYDPHLLPLKIVFYAEHPKNFYDKFTQNPNGYIKAKINGNYFNIFVEEVKFNIIKRDDIEITGYVLNGQDLNKLYN